MSEQALSRIALPGLIPAVMPRPLRRFALSAVFALALLPLALAPAHAQEMDTDVTPEIENISDGLDVPFVPSDYAVLEAMFAFAKPKAEDFVIDLGSGDGRIVLAAAQQYGARGYGVDLNERLVAIANARAKAAGVGARAQFFVRDLFKEDISRASIVTMYLLPDVVLQLRPRLFAGLKPGTRIVSHDYHMGDWRPDGATVIDTGTIANESIVYYWMVPAKVAGTWAWRIAGPRFAEPEDYRMEVDQHFQDIGGRAVAGMQSLRMIDSGMAGDRISFSLSAEMDERIVRQDYLGVVRGDAIAGTVTLSGGVAEMTLPWSARRVRAATR